MKRKRTDPHRKGAIIPGEYTHVLSYNLATTQNSWPIPAFGVNCEIDNRVITEDEDGNVTVTNGTHAEDGSCCVVGLRQAGAKFAEHGSTGKCTACGARFVRGEVWKHEPTGEHVHLGHICGQKYGLMVDRSAFELEAGRRAAAEMNASIAVSQEPDEQKVSYAPPVVGVRPQEGSSGRSR